MHIYYFIHGVYDTFIYILKVYSRCGYGYWYGEVIVHTYTRHIYAKCYI